MRVFDVNSGEPDIYIRVNDAGKPVRAYEVQISKRKLTIQLDRVRGFVENIVLRFKRK